MTVRKVCVLGGTGFIGRHLCCELSRRKLHIRVLTRRRERRRDLIVIPNLDLVEADVHSVADLSVQMKGCDAVVNLIGILNEGRGHGKDFAATHGELPAKVAEACRYNRIDRLLHMSALGASNDGPSNYLKYKAEGENAVHRWGEQGLKITSFRPSVVFGFDDDFFNRFAALLALSPIVFPLACPKARLSPVYVEDVAKAFADSLEMKSTYGQRYDLCGPKQYTLQELVEYTARVAGVNVRILPLNDMFSRLQARLLEWVPGKPFTRDNYLSLQVDNTCDEDGFAAFGIHPTSLECIVPTYIGHQGKMDVYQDLRRAAGRHGNAG
jgi:NADH dehydrogenase